MATISKEFTSTRSPDQIWAVLREFGAVHELAKGFVTATELQEGGKARLVTFANGMQVREWLVSSNDAERRLCYAITESPRHTHYSAVALVAPEGDGSRFVWTVDFLPDEMAGQQEAAMEAGCRAMQANFS